MKIRTDQLRALQETEAQRTKTGKNAGDFTELFSRELKEEATQGAPGTADFSRPVPGGPLGMPNPALLDVQAALEPSAAQPAQSSALEQAAAAMEGMISTLDSYAGQLALDGKADLRQAYSLLENLSGQINGFKARFSGMESEQPELAALINELDVLAATETFKFNRGDYL